MQLVIRPLARMRVSMALPLLPREADFGLKTPG